MTTLDWIIAGATALFAGTGYFRGFIVSAFSLGGFVAGAVLGTRLAAAVLSSGSTSPFVPAFGLLAALLAGAVLASGLEGVGVRLRRITGHIPLFGLVDGLLGAALSACVALGIFWVLGAVALETPSAGAMRRDIQRSEILQRLNGMLPPASSILNVLARFDPLPSIDGPAAAVSAPPAAIAHTASVVRGAVSVVRVLGTACGLGIEGSGWFAAPGEVVTNAHVVAGETDTVIELHGSPPEIPAQVIYFDPHNDIAILRVPDGSSPVLRLADNPRAGVAAAILGYPLDGPFDARAGRIGATQVTLTQDAYGNGPVARLITPLRGLVRPGNSGGPMIDAAGQVVATVFAATVGTKTHGGYGVANSVVAHDLAVASTPVSTQSCTE